MTDVEHADSACESDGVDQQYAGAMLMSSPRGRRVDDELDAAESLDRCGDELAVVC